MATIQILDFSALALSRVAFASVSGIVFSFWMCYQLYIVGGQSDACV